MRHSRTLSSRALFSSRSGAAKRPTQPVPPALPRTPGACPRTPGRPAGRVRPPQLGEAGSRPRGFPETRPGAVSRWPGEQRFIAASFTASAFVPLLCLSRFLRSARLAAFRPRHLSAQPLLLPRPSNVATCPKRWTCPPILTRAPTRSAHPTPPRPRTPPQWFCSLGNSHFFGALNLFRTNWTSIFTGRRYAISPNDPALRQAVHSGVESVVLRWDTPRAARKEISLLLNKCHDAKWAISETGEARRATAATAAVFAFCAHTFAAAWAHAAGSEEITADRAVRRLCFSRTRKSTISSKRSQRWVFPFSLTAADACLASCANRARSRYRFQAQRVVSGARDQLLLAGRCGRPCSHRHAPHAQKALSPTLLRILQVCDADELGALLRIKLGINEADADSGYRDTLVAASIGPEGLAVGADGAAAAAEAGGTGGASAASEHREDELSVSVRAGGGAGEEEAGERGKGAAARQQIQRSATSAAAGSRRESRCTLGEMVAGKEHQSSRRGLPPLPPAAGVAAAMPRSRL